MYRLAHDMLNYLNADWLLYFVEKTLHIKLLLPTFILKTPIRRKCVCLRPPWRTKFHKLCAELVD